MGSIEVIRVQPISRIGSTGISQPARSDLIVACAATFIATLDLMLLPYAILSFMRLY